MKGSTFNVELPRGSTTGGEALVEGYVANYVPLLYSVGLGERCVERMLDLWNCRITQRDH
jgi:hypothetical protein